MTRVPSILEFDLTDEYKTQNTIPAEVINLMGEGRGMGIYWTFQHSISDFSNEFTRSKLPLVIAVGRYGLAWGIAVSPMNRILDVGLIQGSLGSSLRIFNLNLLSISGKSKEISILFIDKDEVRLISMPELKGKSIEETESALEKKFGSCSSLLIGPAAEKGVRFAPAFHEAGIVGKMGFGAVMASKFLKGIVIKNEMKKKEDKQASDVENFIKKELSTFLSTHGHMRIYHNSKSTIQDLLTDFAVYPTIQAKLDWYMGCLSIGPFLDITQTYMIKDALKQCWSTGLDPVSVGSILASIARLNEIQKASPHPKIKFGNGYGLKFISMIGDNSKFGSELALGSEQIMTLRAENPLTIRGVSLPPIHFSRTPFLALSLVSGPMMNSPATFATLMLESNIFHNKWNHWNKTASWISWWHKVWIGFECFGIEPLTILSAIKAKLTSGWKIAAKITLKRMLTILFPDEVIPLPKEQVLRIGERTVLLERLFNSKQGFDSNDERLPKIFFSKENAGTVQRKQFFDARAEYYEDLQINPVGMPMLEVLQKLDLDKIIRF